MMAFRGTNVVKNTGVAAQFDTVAARTTTPIPPQITTPDAEAIRGQSEARFRWLADSAPVLIWESGTDKLCTYVNKPWLDFTGQCMDSQLGTGWAEGIHPEHLQQCLDAYTQSFDRREEFRMEYRLRRYDGEYRWVLDMGVPRFDQDGSFVGYIGIAVDVTDGKKTEQALQQANRVLEVRTAALLAREELLKTFVTHKYQPQWLCSTVTCAIFKSATAFVRIIRLTVQRYWGARTTKSSLTSLNGGRRFTAVVLREKRCERRKTVGIARTARLGFDGTFARGKISMACREGFSSFRRTLPTASKLKRPF